MNLGSQGATGPTGEEAVKAAAQDELEHVSFAEELLEFAKDKLENKDSEGVKKRKGEYSDELARAKKRIAYVQTQSDQQAEAMGANSNLSLEASLPRLSLPKMIGDLGGIPTGKSGKGNVWLEKSLATEMVSIIYEVMMIMAQVKMTETDIQNAMAKMQWLITTKLATAQLDKAELEAMDLEFQALDAFVKAGMTAAMMVVQMAKSAQDKLASAAKAAKANVQDRVEGYGKKAIGHGYQKLEGLKRGAETPAAQVEKNDMEKLEEKTARENDKLQHEQKIEEEEDFAHNEEEDIEIIGEKGKGPGGGAEPAVETGKKEGFLRGLAKDAKTDLRDKFDKKMDDFANTDTNFKRHDSREFQKSEADQQVVAKMETILTSSASGIIALARAENQRLKGKVEYNITLLQGIRDNLSKARDSAHEQIRDAADAIAGILQMVQKYLDLQSQAFRMTR